MLSKTGFTHSDLLCWQIDYAGGSLNVNGTIMRDTYISFFAGWRHKCLIRLRQVKFLIKKPGIARFFYAY
ncbi:hypothetical protein VW31_004262 [Salmonella enterica subsp. enterica]|nr:hypothetical protein [Salmonella enterica subsp. enterica]EEC0837497.1 hypothetical protein [Salmonella enterica subsp. enterica]